MTPQPISLRDLKTGMKRADNCGSTARTKDGWQSTMFCIERSFSTDLIAENEKPQHRVRITKPFYLGRYKVTQQQWEAVMGDNPSWCKGPKNPADGVSFDRCLEFITKLNSKVAATTGRFALPTEAQWEYACRGGEHYALLFW